MRIGTKSVLFGAHCFFLHPWFVAAAWWKLYGFPWDPRLWFAFFLHDIGYLGKPNMDGPEGELHVELGAWLMACLFDGYKSFRDCTAILSRSPFGKPFFLGYWGQMSLLHSRYYAKLIDASPSQLCFADKLSFVLTPRWLYLPMVSATGEIREYLKNAQTADSDHWTPSGYDKRKWHAQLCEYMTKWVEEHKDGAIDTWTSTNRHARTASGVWQ
jgi:hypothetical protein